MTEFLRYEHVSFLRDHSKCKYVTLLLIELAQVAFLLYVLRMEWNVDCQSEGYIKGKTIFLICVKVLNKINILAVNEFVSLTYNIIKGMFLWFLAFNMSQGHQCFEQMPYSFWTNIIWVFWACLSLMICLCTDRDYDQLRNERRFNNRSIELDWIGHDATCLICQETLSVKVTALDCHHQYHTACIKKWIVEYENEDCPNCLANAHDI